MKRLIIARRSSQTFFLILFIYILWSTTYPLKGLIPPKIIFKLDPLVTIFTSISERIILPGIIFSLVMIGLTLIFGRFFCGWMCPLGATIDAVGALRKKKLSPTDATNSKIRKIKYIILGMVAFFALLGMQFAWILDPLVIMARFVSLNLIPTATLIIDRLFIFIIKNTGLHGPVHNFYHHLKSSLLGINIYYFANAGIILGVFLVVVLLAIVMSRAWCRMICPLGALYGLISKISIFRRVIEKCTDCKVCKSNCRTGAIKDDISYVKSECILCMDCIYDCPIHTTSFGWSNIAPDTEKDKEGGISRRNFLFLMASSVFLTGFRFQKRVGHAIRRVIRPPGALKEDKFLNRCVRCGNCMKVCITNGLQPTMLQTGLEGIWTPQLVPEIGYCEYSCTLCGNVCPTGAIPKLPVEKKRKARLGIAGVDRSTCIAWAENKSCIVCEEHCPVPDKAVKLIEDVISGGKILKPYVDKELCIGCGICQHKCPVRPVRAIKVDPTQ